MGDEVVVETPPLRSITEVVSVLEEEEAVGVGWDGVVWTYTRQRRGPMLSGSSAKIASGWRKPEGASTRH